jgi:hypothetical protein
MRLGQEFNLPLNPHGGKPQADPPLIDSIRLAMPMVRLWLLNLRKEKRLLLLHLRIRLPLLH